MHEFILIHYIVIMETVTLKSIFESNKEELSSKLATLSLPKDSELIQKTVTNFLGNLFENEGSYRQNLTESEDYLLQSILRLFQAQQDIATNFAKSTRKENTKDPNSTQKQKVEPLNPYIAVAGAGIGALAGGLVGTWWAVAGGIAGTALVIYYSTKKGGESKSSNKFPPKEESASTIDVAVFLTIVENICQSIDDVITTYRIQVKRLQNVYEQREKPNLLRDYSVLMEQIANVCSVTNSIKETVPSKLSNAIEMLEESLGNYNLKFENGKIIND